jgi:hypothetical protein
MAYILKYIRPKQPLHLHLKSLVQKPQGVLGGFKREGAANAVLNKCTDC